MGATSARVLPLLPALALLGALACADAPAGSDGADASEPTTEAVRAEPGAGAADPVPSSPLASALEPDSARERALGPGVRYARYHVGRGPWAVHAVEADLTRCELFLDVIPPSQVGLDGLVRVTELVRSLDGEVVAAVNGDFFTPEGSPIGVEVSGGAVRFRNPRPALAWTSDREPDVARASRESDSLRLDGWSVPFERPAEGVEIVGGFPQLLEGGRLVGDPAEAGPSTFSGGRQPRTAVAYDPATRRLWMVVVDGRQPDYSAGMTLRELADALSALGPVDALNLDGGGSSVLVVGGSVVNRPSDERGERPVVNALALRRDPARCPEGSGPRRSRTPDSGRTAPE